MLTQDANLPLGLVSVELNGKQECSDRFDFTHHLLILTLYFKQTLAVSQMSSLSHSLVELYFNGAERFTVNVLDVFILVKAKSLH